MMNRELRETRLGKFTASEFYRLMTYESKSIELLMEKIPDGIESFSVDKAIEELTIDYSEDNYVSKAMQWGLDNEVGAVCLFTDITGFEVDSYGGFQNFIKSGEHIGCTPDGIVNDYSDNKCGLEIKCPESRTHIKYLKIKNAEDLKEIEPKYYWQIQGSMLVTGFSYWYFMSYDPRFIAEKNRYVISRIHRVDADIEKLRARLDIAIKIKSEIIQTMT